jgi:general secretion pathway protein B
MSLILDALKKSEAERQRGLPPNLHAQFDGPRRKRRAPWAAGAGAVLLMAGLSGGAFWLSRDATDAAPDNASSTLAGGDQSNGEPVAAPAQMAATSPPESAVHAVTDMAPKATPAPRGSDAAFGGVGGDGNGGTVSGGGLPVPQRAGLFTPTASPLPMVADQPPATPEQGVTAAGAAATSVPAATLPIEVPTAAPSPQTAMSTPIEPSRVPTMDQVPAKPEEVLPLMYQLPYGTRKELPKLELTMHVYSPVREERFIVLNGKRFTLDSPAPGPELTLLDIVADGVVLEFRGQRFLLPNQAY